MGQKIHPTGFRLSVNRNWSSRWFAEGKNFAAMIKDDLQVRAFLKKKLAHASVGRIIIERPAKNAKITIYSARPGVVIGKKGEDIEVLRGSLQKRNPTTYPGATPTLIGSPCPATLFFPQHLPPLHVLMRFLEVPLSAFITPHASRAEVRKDL